MATLIDLRRRIRSVRNSQKITQAMKTVATAKFRKVQRSVYEGRPFWRALPDLARRAAAWAGPVHPLLDRRPERRIEVVVVTSDKGLAGAFNAALLVRAAAFIRDKAAAGAALRLVLLGRKAVNFFRASEYPIDFVRADHTDRLGRDEVKALAEDLMRRYAMREIDAVYVLANEFKSILAPRIEVRRLLPLELPGAGELGSPETSVGVASIQPGTAGGDRIGGSESAGRHGASGAGDRESVRGGTSGPARGSGTGRGSGGAPGAPAASPVHMDIPGHAHGYGVPPEWEPEAAALMRVLLPRYVEGELHRALLESQTAEQAARMIAMDNATKNAEELIEDLTLFLNKVRQASITRELLEIMTAVNALSRRG